MLRRLLPARGCPQGIARYVTRPPATRGEALNQPGDVRVHYKGGVYRKLSELRLQRDAEAGDQLIVQAARPVMATVTDTAARGTTMAFYEHLHPDPHRYYLRPNEMFEGRLASGEPRFARVR